MLDDKNSFIKYFLREDILTDKNGVYKPASRKKISGTFNSGKSKRINSLRIILNRKKMYKSNNNNTFQESNDPLVDSFLMQIGYKNIYLCSDVHFFKNKIKNNKDDTKILMDNFRKEASKLKSNDVLIFLGDISHKLCNPKENKEVQNFLKSINCTKILVKGNHDILPDDYYHKCGFIFVLNELFLDNIIFTHKPVNILNYSFEGVKYNIHGHLHGNNIYLNCNPENHFDVYTSNHKFLNLENIFKKEGLS